MKQIYDVSNVVYGGYYSAQNYRISGFPCGGIRKLLGMINANVALNEQILCFDGGGTIKKELLPRYKSGRVPNYAVMAQLDTLREILTDCDIPFYWDEQYEADDFICSAVHFFKLMNDPEELEIFSDDHDLSCCVADDVKLRNVTSNGATITRENYEKRVVRGQIVPYNTILVHKMVFGDSSDNYLGLNIPGLRFEDLAQAVVTSLEPYIDSGEFPCSAYMQLNIMEIIIDSLGSQFTEEMKQKLKEQAKIVFPQIVDITANGYEAFSSDLVTSGQPHYQVERRHIKVFCNGSFNQKKFDSYCSVFGLNRCRPERFNDKYVQAMDDFKHVLSLKAKDLSNGVMATERYRKKKTITPQGVGLENMQLPL